MLKCCYKKDQTSKLHRFTKTQISRHFLSEVLTNLPPPRRCAHYHPGRWLAAGAWSLCGPGTWSSGSRVCGAAGAAPPSLCGSVSAGTPSPELRHLLHPPPPPPERPPPPHPPPAWCAMKHWRCFLRLTTGTAVIRLVQLLWHIRTLTLSVPSLILHHLLPLVQGNPDFLLRARVHGIKEPTLEDFHTISHYIW